MFGNVFLKALLSWNEPLESSSDKHHNFGTLTKSELNISYSTQELIKLVHKDELSLNRTSLPKKHSVMEFAWRC